MVLLKKVFTIISAFIGLIIFISIISILAKIHVDASLLFISLLYLCTVMQRIHAELDALKTYLSLNLGSFIVIVHASTFRLTTLLHVLDLCAACFEYKVSCMYGSV